jgi:hypothetical protein
VVVSITMEAVEVSGAALCRADAGTCLWSLLLSAVVGRCGSEISICPFRP